MELESQPKKEQNKTWSLQHWKDSWKHTPENPRTPTMPFIYCIFNSEPWPGSLPEDREEGGAYEELGPGNQ